MSRRNIELLLLCAAAPLLILLFGMLAANQGSQLGLDSLLDFNSLGVPACLFLAFVGAHVAVRFRAPNADPALLPIVFALSGVGIAFVTRLAPELAANQVIWLFVSVAAMVVILFSVKSADRLAAYKYTLMIAGLLLLLSPIIPVLGQEIYGSRIWISIAGFSFQPGELAKIVIIIFLAGYLAENREMLSVFTVRLGPLRLPDFKTLLPMLFMWVIALLIVVFEKDLGSALVFFFVFLAMLYIATGKKFYLIAGLSLIAIGGVGAYLAFGHVQVRVSTWLNPFDDAQDTGYQLVQAIFSMADGDLFGLGIGRGFAEQIPIVESDFIFAAIAEEMGLLGAAGVLLLFLSFGIRGYLTAARAKSDVSSLLAAGLTTLIVLQAFIIVGGVTRLIPLTGLTLPFISQGGSSLLSSFIVVGLLLRCGDEGADLETELANTTTSLSANGVLGRVSLGRRLTHATIACSLLFAALVANLTMIMVVNANHYQNMPANNHTLLREASTERGTIYSYDGTILAESVETEDGTYERVYPEGDLATHVIGYASQIYGTSGIENAYNDTLKGSKNYSSWTDAISSMAGVSKPGNSLTLSLNAQLQRSVQDVLKDKVGACVVMDPKTGAVLAMASTPTYDLSSFEDALKAANESDESDSGALVNRAISSLYAPGSTFKIVSLASALENEVASEDTVLPAPGKITIGNGEVSNMDGGDYGNVSLARATELSSNTAFGQLGSDLGPKSLVKTSESFGFNQDVDFALPTLASLMPEPKEMTEWETAWAAAGEPVGENRTKDHPSPAGPQATVLEMALVGCAIANEGEVMQPYIVDAIYGADGQRSFTAQPSKLFQATTSDVANRVKDVLVGVVKNGTGTDAAVDGVEVAGKTGTAEKEYGNNSWFVGMAPADDPNVVVAIVIEDGEEGISTSYSSAIMKQALQLYGDL